MLEHRGVMISDAEFIFPENEIFKCSLEDDYVWEKWEGPFDEGITENFDSIAENMCYSDHAALLSVEYDHENKEKLSAGLEGPAWGKWTCPLCGDVNEDPDFITQTQCCNGHTVFLRSTDAQGQRESFLSMIPDPIEYT
jgi:hypothetical protein